MDPRKTHALPDHYFRLRPFLLCLKRDYRFCSISKMGKARLLDRRKGLFVSRHLFAGQLLELAQAGFGFGKLGDAHSGRKIVISFDDGYASCFEEGMGVLETFGCKAIQFLVSGRIGKANDWDGTGEAIMDKTQVREWLAAGHQIGSHTISPSAANEGFSPPWTLGRDRRAGNGWKTPLGLRSAIFSYPLGA